MNPNWNDIVDQLGPRLFRYFRARFSHEESADLTQEVLIRLVQKQNQGQVDPEKGTLTMLAYGIAHYVALEAKKPLKVARFAHEGPPPFASLEDGFIERENHEILRRALKRLPQAQIEIISLMIDKELSLKDIGVLLDMPIGTVKSHVHRAKELLREALAREECL